MLRTGGLKHSTLLSQILEGAIYFFQPTVPANDCSQQNLSKAMQGDDRQYFVFADIFVTVSLQKSQNVSAHNIWIFRFMERGADACGLGAQGLGIHVPVEARDQLRVSIFQESLTLSFDLSLLGIWNSSTGLGWLVNKPQGSACPHLLRAVPSFFCVPWGLTSGPCACKANPSMTKLPVR